MHLPICPCCTGAVLVTLVQNANWLVSQSFLQLGQGALLPTITESEISEAEVQVTPRQTAPLDPPGFVISNLET